MIDEMKRRKTIGGRTHFWDSTHPNRPEAEKRKEVLKTQGLLVRIFKSTWAVSHPNLKKYGNLTRYIVYSAHKYSKE